MDEAEKVELADAVNVEMDDPAVDAQQQYSITTTSSTMTFALSSSATFAVSSTFHSLRQLPRRPPLCSLEMLRSGEAACYVCVGGWV